jgi:hypothetical protein
MAMMPPSYSAQVKPGSKILGLAMVIENPDGQILIVRPEDFDGRIDVETEWADNTMTKIDRQTGRLELRFGTLVIEEVKAPRTEEGQQKPDNMALGAYVAKTSHDVPNPTPEELQRLAEAIAKKIDDMMMPLAGPPTFTIQAEADDCIFEIEVASNGDND